LSTYQIFRQPFLLSRIEAKFTSKFGRELQQSIPKPMIEKHLT